MWFIIIVFWLFFLFEFEFKLVNEGLLLLMVDVLDSNISFVIGLSFIFFSGKIFFEIKFIKIYVLCKYCYIRGLLGFG